MIYHVLDDNGVGETFLWLLLVLFAGFLIWTGHRLRGNRPGLANGLALLGRSVGLLTFFGIISNHLPAYIGWVPWLSCAFTLLAQLGLFQDRVMHHDHYLGEDNAPGLEGQGQRMMDLHPNYELFKAMLGHVIAVIAVLTNPYSHSIPSAVILILISTFFGLAAVYILPDFASRLEELGGAIVLLIFFGLVFMYLPASVAWVPLLCFALSLVTALWSQM